MLTAAPDDRGFSLIEVLVSLAMFMGVALASSLTLLTSLRFAESNENRVVAAGLATAQMEQARAVTNPVNLAAGTVTVVRSGTTFTVRRQLLPTTGCTVAKTRTITISVEWPNFDDAVRSDTVRACP